MKLAIIGIDQRVIRNSIHFCFQRRAHTSDAFDDRTNVLGETPKRIAVLDVRVDFGVVAFEAKQLANGFGAPNLTRMRLALMHERCERPWVNF